MSIVDNADFIRWLLNFDRSNPLDPLPSEETLGPLPDGFAFIDWEPNDRVARRLLSSEGATSITDNASLEPALSEAFY